MSMIPVEDIIRLFLAFCGGISILGAAAVYVAKAIGWIRRPEVKQNDILKDHEKRIASLESKVDSDYDNIKTLEKEIKMVLKATLAIIKHEVDGNETKQLQETRDYIENYLVDK